MPSSILASVEDLPRIPKQVLNDGTNLRRKMVVSRIDRIDRICNRACIRQSIDKLTVRQRFGDDEDRKNGNTKNG
ncbi:hypothetical protein C8R32_11929 [Nitrosospira sp. Nsp5]|uniref:Uncharacterized protein n=1 Tax=Nitrosospira multiformis TaxID=1231 RepID=A0ABY0THD0_9PROT|nr:MULTISPECIES: hypothetical protein [Nitrosospira]PTR05569.1 hypothetical protein C8R32_11929 [Nitrosospira sp. Nsp5]SDQ83763.1 hypothetical protein SAMN05216402_2492 [Nitrosospira multiformis]